MLGVKKVRILNKDSRSEFAGFGKGYAIEIYDLDKTTRQAFLHDPMESLPDKPDTIGWKSMGWKRAPLDTTYNEIYFRALNYDGSNAEVKKTENDIRSSLKKDKCYCAFYYFPDLKNIRLSQLYVYDVAINRLYIIDSDF